MDAARVRRDRSHHPVNRRGGRGVHQAGRRCHSEGSGLPWSIRGEVGPVWRRHAGSRLKCCISAHPLPHHLSSLPDGHVQSGWTVQEDCLERETDEEDTGLPVHTFRGRSPEKCAMVLGELRQRAHRRSALSVSVYCCTTDRTRNDMSVWGMQGEIETCSIVPLWSSRRGHAHGLHEARVA